MKNKTGQSLIEIVFSVGIIILVLTGVVVLVVSTNKAKTSSLEREKAVELSQTLIENKISEIKNNVSDFWNQASSLNGTTSSVVDGSTINSSFSGYTFYFKYVDCNISNSGSCKIVFTVKWGDNQNLSVERLFSKIGT